MESDEVGVKCKVVGGESDTIVVKSKLVGAESDTVAVESDVFGLQRDAGGVERNAGGTQSNRVQLPDRNRLGETQQMFAEYSPISEKSVPKRRNSCCNF